MGDGHESGGNGGTSAVDILMKMQQVLERIDAKSDRALAQSDQALAQSDRALAQSDRALALAQEALEKVDRTNTILLGTRALFVAALESFERFATQSAKEQKLRDDRLDATMNRWRLESAAFRGALEHDDERIRRIEERLEALEKKSA